MVPFDLRFLGDAVDGGALHTVTSHHAARGFEDFADAIFLDYLFFGHGLKLDSQSNERTVSLGKSSDLTQAECRFRNLRKCR